jgi:hypothetical protein
MVDYVVHRDGSAGHVGRTGGSDERMFFDAVKLWLEGCRHPPPTPGTADDFLLREVFGFRVPRAELTDVDAVIAPTKEDYERGEISPPGPIAGRCSPDKPAFNAPETGTLLVQYVVHRDGHVGEIELKSPSGDQTCRRRLRRKAGRARRS